MKVWVNVFLSPYSKKRFYISSSYNTKELAIKGLGKGANGNKNQTYIDTVPLNINNIKLPNYNQQT